MSLSILTKPEAVLQAIAEYDEVGRDAFLRKYSYSPAREYFLEHEGRRYDSKAIAGVAVGKQHPDRGPLRPDEFSGGRLDTVAKLKELGFTVMAASNQPGEAAPTSDESFASLLTSALEQFAAVKMHPFRKDTELWATMAHLQAKLLSLPSVSSRPNIVVDWSLGKGVWANVPWVALLNRNVTTTTQEGLFVAFLVAEDLSRIYLTLSQGMTALVDELGQTAAGLALSQRVANYRVLAPELSQSGFLLSDDFDLGTQGWRAKNYKTGSIAHLELAADRLPTDAELDAAVNILLIVYDRLAEAPPVSAERPCWFVGAMKDGKDVAPDFLTKGVWINGYKTGPSTDLVREIQPGDRIAIKATFTKKHDLPFVYPKDDVASVMRIKAVGLVTRNHGDGRHLDVNWTQPTASRDWFFTHIKEPSGR